MAFTRQASFRRRIRLLPECVLFRKRTLRKQRGRRRADRQRTPANTQEPVGARRVLRGIGTLTTEEACTPAPTCRWGNKTLLHKARRETTVARAPHNGGEGTQLRRKGSWAERGEIASASISENASLSTREEARGEGRGRLRVSWGDTGWTRSSISERRTTAF